MYALGGRFRAGVSRSTVLKAFGELGSLKGLMERIKPMERIKRFSNRGGDATAANVVNSNASSSVPDDEEKPRGRVTLQSKLLPWHLVQAGPYSRPLVHFSDQPEHFFAG
jgi:hypothetical protein